MRYAGYVELMGMKINATKTGRKASSKETTGKTKA
jgi:hypothetical protein